MYPVAASGNCTSGFFPDQQPDSILIIPTGIGRFIKPADKVTVVDRFPLGDISCGVTFKDSESFPQHFKTALHKVLFCSPVQE